MLPLKIDFPIMNESCVETNNISECHQGYGKLFINHDQGQTSITTNSEKPATSSYINATLLDSGNSILKVGQEVV